MDVKWGYIARFSGSQTQGGVRGWASGGAEATVSVTDYLFDAGASNMGWSRINGIRRACVMLLWQG